MINATKKFNDFTEGLSTIMEIYEPIADILYPFIAMNDECSDEEYHKALNAFSFEDVIKSILVIVSNDPPSIFNENHPNTHSVMVNAYELSYKFPGNVSFGIHTSVSGGDINYEFRISINQPKAIAMNNGIIKRCESNGFTITEFIPQKFNNRNNNR